MDVMKFLKALCASMLALNIIPSAATDARKPVLDQLTPENSVVMLIDYQPQFAFATKSIEIDKLVNNAVGLAKAARAFNVPTVITTITAKAHGGPIFPQIQAVDPNNKAIDRTTINAWQDKNVVSAVKKTGRKKILMAGLWTDNCVMLPALAALADGYEVYVVADASGDSDEMSHNLAIDRLVQAGAVPITWLPVMLEWQADWTRTDTAGAVSKILQEHAPSVGLGIFYKSAMMK